jgi:lambda family phage tail tape measure protein
MIAKMLIMKAISALMNMIPGGGAVGGSLSSLGSSSMSSMSSAITPSFSAMPMAKGGAFDKGVQFFAKGGIFDGPTLFEHAGGLGVAGEAGAEAIMPLTRDGSGVLGVKASGKQTSSNNVNLGAVNITINAKDEATASELKAQLINTIHTEFNKAIKNAQRPGNALNRHQLV